MSNKRFTVLGICLLLIASCTDSEYQQTTAAPKLDSMDLSEVAVALPEGEGKDLLERSCVPCHSLRYIEMQPIMSKKAWEKTVTKMIKAYGAPVRDSIEAGKIVHYLAEIKSK